VPGTYLLPDMHPEPTHVFASILATDAVCDVGSSTGSIGGSIAVSSATADTIEGSVDLTFWDGTVVQGRLVAKACGASQQGYAPGADGGVIRVPPFECRD
jgi:hypothetical protein